MVNDLTTGQQTIFQNVPVTQSATQSYSGPVTNKQVSGLTKWTLDVKDVVTDLRNDMLGVEYDVKERRYLPVADPLMNIEGVNRVMGFAKFDHSKGVVLSNFDKEEVNTTCEEFESLLSFSLHMKRKKYRLDRAYILPLRAQVGRSVKASYNRAINASTAKLLSETQTHSEVITNQPGQKRGIWGWLKGGLK